MLWVQTPQIITVIMLFISVILFNPSDGQVSDPSLPPTGGSLDFTPPLHREERLKKGVPTIVLI